MLTAIDITFVAATVLFIVAAVASFVFLRGLSDTAIDFTRYAVTLAAALLAVSFGLRWYFHGRIPLTTMVDVLNVLLITASAIVLPLVNQPRLRPLLCYYAPPLAALSLFNLIVGRPMLRTVPKELNEAFVALHVGPVILAFALFFVASLTGVAYIIQARRLKSLRTTTAPAKLPPLEHLDATLFNLIKWGYPFFCLTLVLGIVGAFLFPDELNSNWWLSPKIVLAVLTAMLFAFSFHSRKQGLLRGQKLAYVVVVGFAVMLTVYLLLESTGLKDYGFWSKPA